MRVHRVDRQGDGLDVTLGELLFQLGGKAQFGGAHRGEVGWVREQHAPASAQPFVEANLAGAGILFEVGGDIAQS